MIDALFLRRECVPYSLRIKPIPVTHSSTSRAYWRVLKCPVRSTRLGKDIIIYRATTALKPRQQTGPGIWQKLELNRPACLLLPETGARSDLPATDDVADLHPHKVAATQIARSNSARSRKRRRSLRKKRISHICFGLSARFAPTDLPAFQT